MKCLFLFSFILLCIVIHAQVNLVPNPSFEEYDTCPDSFSQITRATGWYSSRPTADYFNVCSPYYPRPFTCVSVPSNTFGNRTSASGNGYAGIISKQGNNEHREHIGGKLISPLQIGVKYYVSFQVSVGAYLNFYQWCGINKMGMLFSSVKHDSFSPSPICNNCAQVTSDSIITDTLNWIKITGSFIADSNYAYVNIGRFNFNSLTDTLQLVGTNCYAYLFVDDVCVSTDSLFAYQYLYTSMPTIRLHDLKESIFPNPFDKHITIRGSPESLHTIYLSDLAGRILETFQPKSLQEYTLDLSDIEKGVYTLTITKANSLTTNHIIIKN